MKKIKQKNNQIIELLGWIGVGLIISGYFLVSAALISGDEIIYHTLMLAGSLLVAVISIQKHAKQPALLNILFAIIASYAIVRILVL